MKKKKGEEIEIGKRKPSPTPLLTQPGLHPSFPRAAREQPHPFRFGPARSHSFPFFRSVQLTPRRSPATARPPCSPRQRALTPGPDRHKHLHALLPRSARSRLSPAPHASATTQHTRSNQPGPHPVRAYSPTLGPSPRTAR